MLQLISRNSFENCVNLRRCNANNDPAWPIITCELFAVKSVNIALGAHNVYIINVNYDYYFYYHDL